MKNPPVLFGNARFTFLSDRTFKAEYSPDGKFPERELFVTQINSVLPVRPEKNTRGSLLRIRTPHLTVEYDASVPGFCKNSFRVLYDLNGKTKKWKFGRKDRRNLGGSMLHLFKYPRFTRHRDLSGGALSRNGYFAFLDHTHTFWDREKKWPCFDRTEGRQILFFSAYGMDYSRGLEEFARIFGRAPLPPLWAFGFWYSRWHPYTQEEYLRIAERYKEAGIPLDVMVVDTDWRKNVWNGYDWSEKYFPDPDRFIRGMKKRRIRTGLNDHPGYNSSEPLLSSDSHFTKIQQRLKSAIKDRWACHWGKREEVEAFLDILIKPKLKQGIDFWWIDGWGADGIYRNEEFFRKNRKADRMALGSSGYETLNPQMWLNFFYYRAMREAARQRPFVLTRWGGLGSHRYPAWFSGDTYSTWKTLAYQVFFTATAGNALTHYWSHDLGGFLGRKIPRDLFIRWIQFGAFSAIMRTHSDHGIREPWNFDQETLEIFRKYTRIRYRLLPFLYSSALLSWLKARPLIRAMYHNYPAERESYAFRHQYMIGDFLLVAPVIKKRGRKRIFFPEGEWIGPENMHVTTGKSVRTMDVPLSRIPFFIKKGAIIPAASEVRQAGAAKNHTLRFEIFPDRESEYVYYEDDGLTEDYLKGRFIQIPVRVSSGTDRITVRIGKQKGNYKGLPEKRRLEIALHSLKNINVRKARIGSRPCPFRRISGIFGEIPSVLSSYEAQAVYAGTGLELAFFIE